MIRPRLSRSVATRTGARRAHGAGGLRAAGPAQPRHARCQRRHRSRSSTAPRQYFASPDARDYAEGRGTFNAPEVTVVKVPATARRSTSSASALDWSDVAIGAGAALGVMLLAIGGSLAVRQSVTSRTACGLRWRQPAGRGPCGPARSARAAPRRARRGRDRAPPGASAPTGRRPAGRRPSASAITPFVRAGASIGSATIPAVRWTISEASASRRLASRPSPPPSATAPIRRSGASGGAGDPRAELERRPVVPGGAERHQHRARARRPARRDEHRDVAWRLLEDDAGVAARARASRLHEQQVDALLVGEARRRRAPAPATRTPPSWSRPRRPAAPAGARRAPPSRRRGRRRRRSPR